jgi:hypothetical protein
VVYGAHIALGSWEKPVPHGQRIVTNNNHNHNNTGSDMLLTRITVIAYLSWVNYCGLNPSAIVFRNDNSELFV